MSCMGQSVSVHTGSIEPFQRSEATELAEGKHMHAVPSSKSRTSTVMADGSGRGDTDRGSLWFDLMANRFSKGIPHSCMANRNM